MRKKWPVLGKFSQFEYMVQLYHDEFLVTPANSQQKWCTTRILFPSASELKHTTQLCLLKSILLDYQFSSLPAVWSVCVWDRAWKCCTVMLRMQIVLLSDKISLQRCFKPFVVRRLSNRTSPKAELSNGWQAFHSDPGATLLFSYREELDNFLCKNTFFHPLYEAHQLCLFSGKMFFSCKLLTHQIGKLRVIFLQKENASELMSEQRRGKVRTYFQGKQTHTHK